MHLIVGLGNPGAKYARTRHNVGFQLVERLAKNWQVTDWAAEKKFHAKAARVERNGQRVMLVRPQTYMNDSGESVGAMMGFYHVPAAGLMVVVDDADLPLGRIRLRPRGSSGGHHGLESIEQHLGSRDFARLRVGIGRTADGRREITNYVLAPFAAEEMPLLDAVLAAAAGQIECWLDDGMEQAMNEFNGAVEVPAQQKEN
jgi:PTH1 family peptidyl-tRNA hydrolase